MLSKLSNKLSLWVIILIIFYVGGTALVGGYYIYRGEETANAFHSINDARINVNENPPSLSLAVSNSGNVELEITAVKVGDRTYELPVEGMLGSRTMKTGQRTTLYIPLEGEFKIGKQYELEIITDPSSTPKNELDAIATG